jgi:hypothetical protein
LEEHERDKNVYKIFVGKPERTRPLRRFGRRCGDRIICQGNVLGGYGLHSSDPEYGSVAGSYEHDNEPSGTIKFGEFLD